MSFTQSLPLIDLAAAKFVSSFRGQPADGSNPADLMRTKLVPFLRDTFDPSIRLEDLLIDEDQGIIHYAQPSTKISNGLVLQGTVICLYFLFIGVRFTDPKYQEAAKKMIKNSYWDGDILETGGNQALANQAETQTLSFDQYKQFSKYFKIFDHDSTYFQIINVIENNVSFNFVGNLSKLNYFRNNLNPEFFLLSSLKSYLNYNNQTQLPNTYFIMSSGKIDIVKQGQLSYSKNGERFVFYIKYYEVQ